MKGVNILKLLFLLFCVCSQAYGQETILTTFENREQFVHVSQMSSGNYLVSGRTHELGAKTDLVLMLDPQGQEIKRSVLCPDFQSRKFVTVERLLWVTSSTSGRMETCMSQILIWKSIHWSRT